MIITINQHIGPLTEGGIFSRPAQTFFDTGSIVNLISSDILKRVEPKVKFIEPTHYSLQEVTGSKLNTIGKTRLTIALGKHFQFDIISIIVEKPTSPGDLLIEFATMRYEEITISPAEYGARCSYKFIPFINSEILVCPTVTINERTNNLTNSLDNVAERSIPTARPETPLITDKYRFRN